MTDSLPPLTLRVEVPERPLEFGHEGVVALDLSLSETSPEPVDIDQVILNDAEKLVDSVPCIEAQGVTLRAGESYRIAQRLIPKRYGGLPCSAWVIVVRWKSQSRQFEVRDQQANHVPLVGRLEDCLQACFRVESRDDTGNVNGRLKVGTVSGFDGTIEKLTIRLNPDSAILAGHLEWRLGDVVPPASVILSEPLLVKGDHLELRLSGLVNGQPMDAVRRLTVQPPPPMVPKPVEFLHLDRLTPLQQTLTPIDRNGNVIGNEVPLCDGEYPVVGGGTYRLTVRSELGKPLDRLETLTVPPRVAVTRAPLRVEQNGWAVELEIIHKAPVGERDRLTFEVSRGDDRIPGELHLCIRPTTWQKVRKAFEVGGLVLITALFNIFALLLAGDNFVQSDRFWTIVAGLAAVPVLWLGLTIYDKWHQRQAH